MREATGLFVNVCGSTQCFCASLESERMLRTVIQATCSGTSILPIDRRGKHSKTNLDPEIAQSTVMPVPIGESSAFFYKSKLNCYNFTVTDIKNKTTRCYFWHECLGNRGAIEIGTCVLEFFKNIAESHPNCDVVFYSDNCCGQQKNRYMLGMYYYAVSTLNINSKDEYEFKTSYEEEHSTKVSINIRSRTWRKSRRDNVSARDVVLRPA
ncbi:unnamed protein product, partial [Brenthis ino]